MNKKEKIKKKTIKQQVIDDFLENKIHADSIGLNYLPSGYLKFYLTDGRFPTYQGKVLKEYCDVNNIKLIKAKELGVSEYEGEKVNQNMTFFVW